jgi:hypothetical protein
MANYIFNINGNGCTNQKIGQYDKDNCDVTSISIAAKTEGESLWDGVSITTNTNGEITLTVPANSSTTNGRTQEVTISYTIGETEGSIDATLCQKNNGSGPPSVCCSSYSFGEIINIIPDTGVTTTPLAVINLTSTSEECDFSNVTVTSSTITELSVDSSNGTVYVNKCSAVGQEEVKTHVITLVSNGTTCSSVSHEIPQDGDTSRCDCTSIDSWVIPLKRTFDNTRHNNQLIASADTRYCGIVSATTSSNMLYGGNVICDYTHGERNSVAYIYASIESNSGEERSCAVKLFFKRAGSSEFGECVNKDIILVQGDNYASCNKIVFDDTVEFIAEQAGAHSWTFDVPDGTCYYYGIKTEILSGEDLITRIDEDTRNNDKRTVRVSYKDNPTENDRSALIKCTPHYDVMWYGGKWVGGIPCDPVTIKLTLKAGAGAPCECTNAELVLVNNPYVITQQAQHYEHIHVYFTCNGNRTKLPTSYKIKIKSYSPDALILLAENNGWTDADGGCYDFRLTIAENTTGEARQGNIVFSLEKDGVECKTYTQQIKNDEVVCLDCEQALAGITLLSTNTGIDPIGRDSRYISDSNSNTCYRSLSYSQCDSNGNAATYDWFSFLSLVKPGKLHIKIDPNTTSSKRTGYIKLIPLDKNDNPVFSNCSKIATISQLPFSACTCANHAEETTMTVTASTSSTNRIVAGETNVNVGKIRFTTKKVDLSCVDISVTTTMSQFITNIQYTKGDIVFDTYYNNAYVDFNITCDTHDGGENPEWTATIDVHLKINGAVCDNAIFYKTVTVYLVKPQ